MPAIQASHRRLEVAGVARAEVVALEQDEHIGDLEILVPARFAADLRAQAHVSLEQGRHFGDDVVRQGQDRQWFFGSARRCSVHR